MAKINLRHKGLFVSFAVPLLLGGCTAAWIDDPNPSIQGLVRDLTLQGYECIAGSQEISCNQEVPIEVKQSSLCAEGICTRRPPRYMAGTYKIRQTESGMPSIQHRTVEVPAPEKPSTPGVSKLKQ
jgi:hypothetical protein